MEDRQEEQQAVPVRKWYQSRKQSLIRWTGRDCSWQGAIKETGRSVAESKPALPAELPLVTGVPAGKARPAGEDKRYVSSDQRSQSILPAAQCAAQRCSPASILAGYGQVPR